MDMFNVIRIPAKYSRMIARFSPSESHELLALLFQVSRGEKTVIPDSVVGDVLVPIYDEWMNMENKSGAKVEKNLLLSHPEGPAELPVLKVKESKVKESKENTSSEVQDDDGASENGEETKIVPPPRPKGPSGEDLSDVAEVRNNAVYKVKAWKIFKSPTELRKKRLADAITAFGKDQVITAIKKYIGTKNMSTDKQYIKNIETFLSMHVNNKGGISEFID